MQSRAALPVVLTTAVLAEVMRVSFPLLYDVAGEIGFATAAWFVPALFAVPLLLAPFGRWVHPRMLLVVGCGGLAVARVVLQAQDHPEVTVALSGTLLGLLGLAAALRTAASSAGGALTSSALFLGLTVDTAIRLGLTTWDAAWQSTPAAWLIGLSLPAALAASIVAGRAVPVMVHRPVGDARLAMLIGPLFALQTLYLANPGFVASSGAVALPVAGAAVLAGLAFATAAPALRGRAAWVARACLLASAVLFTGPSGVTGVVVVVGVVAAQASIGVLAATACARCADAVPDVADVGAGTTGGAPRAVRSAVPLWLGAGAGSLALVAVLLPYQISYETPLGVPQPVFAAAGALIVVVLAWSRPGGARSAPDVAELGAVRAPARGMVGVRRAAVVAPVVAMAVPAWSWLTWPEPEEATAGAAGAGGDSAVRAATYNIHSAVSWHGALDPEGIARVLEDGRADVAMLQEVSRGWPLGGGLDAAAWLSRRLGTAVAYGGAADHQFGNAVLSRHPITAEWSGEMDRGSGTMRRGYVGATVELGSASIDVWSTHLQHQDHTTETRRAQARQVVAAWRERGAGTAVFGGDMNSRPGSPDIEPWFDGTGLVSAQDAAVGSPRDTSPAAEPDHRIDWILATADLDLTEVVVPSTLASDHLPVFATVDGADGVDGTGG